MSLVFGANYKQAKKERLKIGNFQSNLDREVLKSDYLFSFSRIDVFLKGTTNFAIREYTRGIIITTESIDQQDFTTFTISNILKRLTIAIV